MSLATGDLEAARRESAEAVSADPMGINSPNALAIQARACLWLRDVKGAREALTAMKSFRGRWVAVARLTVEAGLACPRRASGGGGRNLPGSHRGVAGARLHARSCSVRVDLVMLLGPDHPDATVAKEARDIFTQLGAKPFLERLDRAAGIGPQAS